MAKDPPLLDKARAGLAYSRFTGALPKGAYRVKLDRGPTAAYRLGSLVGVAYEATRDGQTERYFHEFKRAARPDLAVKADGRQLYITRGSYRVTDRGIEDMSALFVVNPSRRPSLRKNSKGKPMASVARRRRRSASGRFTKASFRRNPAPRRARRSRRRSVAIFTRNPIRRRRRAVMAARRGGVRRFRRNPISGKGNINMLSMILPAIGIGAGAVVAEMAMGYLPIPANFKTGVARNLTKGAIGLGGGWLIAKYANRRMGEAVALGAMIIAAHDTIKDTLVKVMPNMAMGYYSPGQRVGSYLPAVRGAPMGQYVQHMAGAASDGFGMYMGGKASDGYASPAFG